MANSQELTRYKQQIMSLIINNEKIFELIDNPNVDFETSEKLIGKNVFNFIRLPEAPEEEKTYICIEVDIPDIRNTYYNKMFKNKMFKEVIVTIYIITAERLMPTKYGGTRTDLISAELDTMLNNYQGIGFDKIKCISNVANGIGVKHRCRIMTFTTEDLIDGMCGN